jgi:hypothetical protein
MTLTEALAERASRGELTPPELQEAVAILLRDLLSRGSSGGVVESGQDDVPTRKIASTTRGNLL